MRSPLILLPVVTTLLALAPFARASEDPEPGETPLPPIRIHLSSFGTVSRLTLRAEGPLTITDTATGEAVPPPQGQLVVTHSGRDVLLAGHRAASYRVEAACMTVETGRAPRTYPGALLVTAGKAGISLVNECDLEHYTEGVLAGECPALFHPEAIKAMAVAARSYSYRRAYLAKTELCDTTHCQVYRGIGNIRPTIHDAVTATSGMCATYAGEVIDAVYSSDCGGETEANEEAWKNARPIPYLRPVVDAPQPGAEPYCAVNRAHRWSLVVPFTRLKGLLGKAVPQCKLEPVEVTASGRVRRLELLPESAAETMEKEGNGFVAGVRRVFSGEQWRQLLGLSAVKSLKFEVRQTDKGVELEGSGFGHGVGLCQFGANGMGRKGAEFTEILKHYYTGIDVGPAPSIKESLALIAQRRMAAAGTAATRMR